MAHGATERGRGARRAIVGCSWDRDGRAGLPAGGRGIRLGWLSGLPWRPLSLSVAVLGGIVAWAFWPPVGSSRALDCGGRSSGRSWHLAAGMLRRWSSCCCSRPSLGARHCRMGCQAGTSTTAASRATSSARPTSWASRGPVASASCSSAATSFPTYFLNDVQRFNFYGAEAERRRNLPFSVRWDGDALRAGRWQYQLWLTASGPGHAAARRKAGRRRWTRTGATPPASR